MSVVHEVKKILKVAPWTESQQSVDVKHCTNLVRENGWFRTGECVFVVDDNVWRMTVHAVAKTNVGVMIVLTAKSSLHGHVTEWSADPEGNLVKCIEGAVCDLLQAIGELSRYPRRLTKAGSDLTDGGLRGSL